jgi:hypothetical protein
MPKNFKKWKKDFSVFKIKFLRRDNKWSRLKYSGLRLGKLMPLNDKFITKNISDKRENQVEMIKFKSDINKSLILPTR